MNKELPNEITVSSELSDVAQRKKPKTVLRFNVQRSPASKVSRQLKKAATRILQRRDQLYQEGDAPSGAFSPREYPNCPLPSSQRGLYTSSDTTYPGSPSKVQEMPLDQPVRTSPPTLYTKKHSVESEPSDDECIIIGFSAQEGPRVQLMRQSFPGKITLQATQSDAEQAVQQTSSNGKAEHCTRQMIIAAPRRLWRGNHVTERQFLEQGLNVLSKVHFRSGLVPLPSRLCKPIPGDERGEDSCVNQDQPGIKKAHESSPSIPQHASIPLSVFTGAPALRVAAENKPTLLDVPWRLPPKLRYKMERRRLETLGKGEESQLPNACHLSAGYSGHV